MNEATILSDFLEKRQNLCLELQPTMGLIILGYLQLALRHPATGDLPTREHIRRFCDDLITNLAGGETTIELLLRRGDRPEFDDYPG